RVIPFPWRRWRKQFRQAWSQGEPQQFLKELRLVSYNAIIDAQGLLKSAIPARLARGHVWGLDLQSAREPLASLCYHRTLPIARNQHAVNRLRQLFACVFGYPLPTDPPDYGLGPRWTPPPTRDYLVFIHGTTCPSKHWPEKHWQQLAGKLDRRLPIWLPWGNAAEKKRAEAIAATAPHSARVLGSTNLEQLANILAAARGVVTVDTGPAHLAAALETPGICLYGPTDPALVGTLCPSHHHHRGSCPQAPCQKKICPLNKQAVPPPCMEAITPVQVERWLETLK
ncbi:MAG TPA: lipopolysaccharide heptosyltransferase I, partial [Magnetococcales bacterium]|nr:lipopolysaccharide heptosyltransferase I [Magnetococcales bacterium]